MSTLRLERGLQKTMIELSWSDRFAEILELADYSVEARHKIHSGLSGLSREIEELRPCHPLLPLRIREIALFKTSEQGKGVFEVFRSLSELFRLGLGLFLN